MLDMTMFQKGQYNPFSKQYVKNVYYNFCLHNKNINHKLINKSFIL